MPDKINDELKRVPFNDSPGKDQRYSEYYSLFQDYKDHKLQSVRSFNKNGINRNILNYVQDSVDRMNEYHLKPAHKEDWQNNVFDPITRDKLIAILSKLASARMKPELIMKPFSIFSTDDIAARRNVYTDLLESANYHNSDGNQLIWELFTVLSEGTVIGYESWMKGTRKVDYVKEFDPDTGAKKTESMTIDDWDDVYGEIVPIDEFYPETMWMSARDFGIKMKKCFRAREMTLDGFMAEFGAYPQAKTVYAANSYMDADGKLPWGISSDIDQSNVLVLYWYDETRDKHGIWANGTELYWGCFPWNHKKLPFWLGIGEPIHHQLLWGKSLPDKLMGMQDIDNAVFNAMLDQLYLALNSPTFIDGVANLEEGYLEPGRIYEIDAGAKVQQANVGNVDSASFPMLNLIRRSMETSSLSDQAQGVPTGGRKTKFEVQSLQEGAMNIAALTLQLMEDYMTRKYRLRMYNILQYYSMPSRKKSGKKQFKYIEIENAKLTNNKIGTKKIQIVGGPSEVVPGEQLQSPQFLGADQAALPPEEQKVEAIVLDRDYLMHREFDLDVRMIPNASVKDSEIDRKNKNIQYFQLTRQDPLFNPVDGAKDLAEAFDKPESVVVEPQQQGPSPQEVTNQGVGPRNPEFAPPAPSTEKSLEQF
jgi:hypothetical protein